MELAGLRRNRKNILDALSASNGPGSMAGKRIEVIPRRHRDRTGAERSQPTDRFGLTIRMGTMQLSDTTSSQTISLTLRTPGSAACIPSGMIVQISENQRPAMQNRSH